MSLDYAVEKMDQLVECLATDPDPLPLRLEGVYIPLTGALGDAERLGYLPAELLARLKVAKERLTRIAGPQGSLPATITTMTADEASELARELVDLRYAILAIAHPDLF